MKKMIAMVLSFMLFASCTLCVQAADIPEDLTYIAQIKALQSNGKYVGICTFVAMQHMLYRKQILVGDEEYFTFEEIRASKAPGGIPWSYTYVSRAGYKYSVDISYKYNTKDAIISYLSEHPEGLWVYVDNTRDREGDHAIVLTRYDENEQCFYAIDGVDISLNKVKGEITWPNGKTEKIEKYDGTVKEMKLSSTYEGAEHSCSDDKVLASIVYTMPLVSVKAPDGTTPENIQSPKNTITNYRQDLFSQHTWRLCAVYKSDETTMVDAQPLFGSMIRMNNEVTFDFDTHTFYFGLGGYEASGTYQTVTETIVNIFPDGDADGVLDLLDTTLMLDENGEPAKWRTHILLELSDFYVLEFERIE